MRLARLTQRKQFLAAAEHGRRFRSSVLTVQVRDAAEEVDRDGLRLGLTASRKVGNAVKRNRIRRRLRAAAELALGAQAGRACDVVIIARTETLSAGFEALVADLSIALDRARPAKPRPAKPIAARSGRKPPQDQRRAPDSGSAPAKP
jgi:ribonuclease P protein component